MTVLWSKCGDIHCVYCGHCSVPLWWNCGRRATVGHTMVIVAMVTRRWRSDDTEVTMVRTVGRTVGRTVVIVAPPWSLC